MARELDVERGAYSFSDSAYRRETVPLFDEFEIEEENSTPKSPHFRIRPPALLKSWCPWSMSQAAKTSASRVTFVHRQCWRKGKSGVCVLGMIFVLSLFGLLQLVLFVVSVVASSTGTAQFIPLWAEAQDQYYDRLAKYPKGFLGEVTPTQCHSHNDYWRPVPLFDALMHGLVSVEADVWSFGNGELYVGHDTRSLTPEKTLRSLYLDPIYELLERQNDQSSTNHGPLHGIFDRLPEQTLILLIDFKTDGEAIFQLVEKQLHTLRSKNYLTYFNGHSVVTGAVTIVATGEAPFGRLDANQTYRDIFFDAPLDLIYEDSLKTASTPQIESEKAHASTGQGHAGLEGIPDASVFQPENSWYASLKFTEVVSRFQLQAVTERQRLIIREQVKAAHAQGLKVRYWGTPTWPAARRNYVWRVLKEEGVDFLNVDDLDAAARQTWMNEDEIKNGWW